MAGVTGSQRVTYIVLRAMRTPLFVLIGVYAASMLGWVLIPGPPGNPEPMSFFHGFYFLAYAATTTGFGELPYAFSEAQRMWAIVSLYAGVVAWLYALGSIIQLIQNPHLNRALAERRFAKHVLRLNLPFVIVCGFGNRGSLLTRGLSDSGLAAVILDSDPDRVAAVHLRDYRVPTPALCADPRTPERLIDAGLLSRHCRAVVALTNDEAVNAKIAISARLLNSQVRVVTQLTQDVYEETLATLGGDIHIVDPFQTFARYLAATLRNPAVHMLSEWLIGAPNANLAMYADIPPGRWILCGFGRMGRSLREAMDGLAIPNVVIDPELAPEMADGRTTIAGRADQRTLKAAGIEDAVGIVAGTNADTDNLGIALIARALNPRIFVVVRQNLHRNKVLFDAAAADLIVQPTLVSARRILFMLIAPLLRTFFEHVRERQLKAEDRFLMDAITELHDIVGGTTVPRLWEVTLTDADAPALMRWLCQGMDATLGDVLRDPSDRARRLACVPLVIRSRDEAIVMPPLTRQLSPGDRILLCGQRNAFRLLDATLYDDHTLRYLVTGVDEPRTLVMRWLARRHQPGHEAAAG